MKLWCATGNSGKLREFRLAADRADLELEAVPGFKSLPPAVEDGRAFEENAIRKALHYARYVNAGLLFAVVFPLPFGPRKPQILPAGTCRSM